MKKTKKLAYTLLISLIILLPSTSALARRKNEVLITVPIPPSFLYPPIEEPMPNGFLKVDWGIQFYWYYDGEEVGTAEQYVTGIIRNDGIAMLKGYGIYTSSDPDLPGTITYTIGNNWDMNTGEIWAFHMRITGGTGSFEGIKGTGSDDAYPDFLLYLNFNPW